MNILKAFLIVLVLALLLSGAQSLVLVHIFKHAGTLDTPQQPVSVRETMEYLNGEPGGFDDRIRGFVWSDEIGITNPIDRFAAGMP